MGREEDSSGGGANGHRPHPSCLRQARPSATGSKESPFRGVVCGVVGSVSLSPQHGPGLSAPAWARQVGPDPPDIP